MLCTHAPHVALHAVRATSRNHEHTAYPRSNQIVCYYYLLLPYYYCLFITIPLRPFFVFELWSDLHIKNIKDFVQSLHKREICKFVLGAVPDGMHL